MVRDEGTETHTIEIISLPPSPLFLFFSFSFSKETHLKLRVFGAPTCKPDSSLAASAAPARSSGVSTRTPRDRKNSRLSACCSSVILPAKLFAPPKGDGVIMVPRELADAARKQRGVRHQ